MELTTSSSARDDKIRWRLGFFLKQRNVPGTTPIMPRVLETFRVQCLHAGLAPKVRSSTSVTQGVMAFSSCIHVAVSGDTSLLVRQGSPIRKLSESCCTVEIMFSFPTSRSMEQNGADVQLNGMQPRKAESKHGECSQPVLQLVHLVRKTRSSRESFDFSANTLLLCDAFTADANSMADNRICWRQAAA